MKKNVIGIIKTFISLCLIRFIYLILALQVLSKEAYSLSSTGGFDIKFNEYKEILSILVFFLVTFLFLKIKQNNHFNFFLNNLLFIEYYIPMNVAFSLNDKDFVFFILSNVFYLFLMYFINRNSLKLDKVRTFTFNYTYVRYYFIIICLLMIIYKIVITGFSFYFGLESSIIYENRSNYVNNLSANLLAYLFRLIVINSASFICPIFLYISLYKKDYVGIVISVLSVLARYTLTYEKTFIFLLPIIFIIYFLFEKLKWNFVKKNICNFFMFGLLGVELIFLITNNSDIYYLVIRRVFFVPAWLNGIYYDFFSMGKKIWFTQDFIILETLLPDIYESTPLKLISEYYFLGKMPSPNTGLFAEAYMQAGILGTILFPIFLYGIFKTMEIVFKSFGVGCEFFVAAYVMLVITNSPVFSKTVIFSIVFPTYLIFVLSKLKKLYMFKYKRL